jgi:hypothetical protein
MHTLDNFLCRSVAARDCALDCADKEQERLIPKSRVERRGFYLSGKPPEEFG